jgi:hypothetical protein
MGSHQSAAMITDEWLTPPEWIEALGGPEGFDLDPCAAPAAPEPWPTALTHYRTPSVGSYTEGPYLVGEDIEPRGRVDGKPPWTLLAATFTPAAELAAVE